MTDTRAADHFLDGRRREHTTHGCAPSVTVVRKEFSLPEQAKRLVTAGAKSVLVATNDRCIRDCVSGAYFVSSASLLNEVTKVRLT